MNDISITRLDRHSIGRYLEYKNCPMDDKLMTMIDVLEEHLLKACHFRYVYKCFDLIRYDAGIAVKDTELILCGKSIDKHLRLCDKVILTAGTLSPEVDKLIKRAEIKDMLEALVYDAMANVAIEQGMEKLGNKLELTYKEYNHTFRFGVGYGDLSIDIQKSFLDTLEATKNIGLYVNDSNLMIPTKSISAIIGISKESIDITNTKCELCNMKDACRLRIKGERCNV